MDEMNILFPDVRVWQVKVKPWKDRTREPDVWHVCAVDVVMASKIAIELTVNMYPSADVDPFCLSVIEVVSEIAFDRNFDIWQKLA